MRAKLMGFFLLGLIRLLTGAQARWHGCPPKAEQRIYFANHQSHADLLLIWAALPQVLRTLTRPIAARDYLAQKFPQVVLVPAWINNVQRVMPKGEVVPVPVLCSVTFGAPVTLGEGEARKDFLVRARQAVVALREV